MTDHDEAFEKLIGGGFGQMEAQLGTDAYQTQIKQSEAYIQSLVMSNESQRIRNEALVEELRATTSYVDARASFYRSVAAILNAVSLLAIVCGVAVMVVIIPCVVWLWLHVV